MIGGGFEKNEIGARDELAHGEVCNVANINDKSGIHVGSEVIFDACDGLGVEMSGAVNKEVIDRGVGGFELGGAIGGFGEITDVVIGS